jgi:hypothetical protein
MLNNLFDPIIIKFDNSYYINIISRAAPGGPKTAFHIEIEHDMINVV